MNFLRKVVLIWMLAWLPLSGAIAAAMGISGMSAGTGASRASETLAAVESADETAAADISAMPCHGTAESSDAGQSGTCTHCLLCHLAVSLLLPYVADFQGRTPSHIFAASLLASHVSFIPELASPPPRSDAR